MDTKIKNIVIDEKEYQVDSLSDVAKNIAGFINRLDTEAQELKYQLDKTSLARKQAIADLKSELNKNPE